MWLVGFVFSVYAWLCHEGELWGLVECYYYCAREGVTGCGVSVISSFRGNK